MSFFLNLGYICCLAHENRLNESEPTVGSETCDHGYHYISGADTIKPYKMKLKFKKNNFI